jgi:hypothetical protein
MGQTAIQSDGLASGCITRSKLNTTLAASAVVAKVLNGVGIAAAKTGVDTGTGDVTLSVDQTFTPTWTGEHTFNQNIALATSTGVQLGFTYNGYNYVTASGAAATLQLQATGASGTVSIAARGSTILTAALGVQIGAPTGGDFGAGTLNLAGGMAGLYLNGTALQTLAPTWTGEHTWNVTSNATGATGINTNNQSTAPLSYGILALNTGSGYGLVATNSNATGGIAFAAATTSTGSTAAGIAILATSAGTGAAISASNSSTGGVAITVTQGGVKYIGTGVQVGAPTGGDEGNGTINVASGYYLNGVNQFQTGTFTATLTGVSGTVTGTATYSISGKTVTLCLGCGSTAIAGTSNANTMTMTGLPAALQPATMAQFIPCTVENNSGNVLAMAAIGNGNSTISFFMGSPPYSASGFSTSGTKGLNGTVLTYSLQ